MAENNYKVAVSTDFLFAFAKLPRQVQGKMTEFVNKFRNDPMAPGMNYEKLKNSVDKKLYSVRINDTYRGIVVRQPESGVFILLWVDHHDEAYAWAAKKRCEVNSKTGTLQVFDMQSAEEQAERAPAVPAAEPLFASVKDADLLKLAVPEAQLAYVRSFTDKAAFVKAADTFPHDAYEYLSWLVEGVPVAEVLELAAEERGEAKKIGDDIAAALDVPMTQKTFVVIDGEDELRRIMAEPLEKWRVFLHPTQRRIVKNSYKASARVLGGAGTGKTVVAMHRAKALASGLKDRQRILFTTYTANLAADIKENLRKICTLEEMRRIEVIHLDAWVNQYLRSVGFSARIAYDKEIYPLWNEAIVTAGSELPFDVDFYEEEWNRVAVAQEAMTQAAYMKATRNGRGTRLDRKKRMQIWKVFEVYQRLMKEEKIRDINTAMYECAKLLEGENSGARYQHVIVDEGQDFSDNAYRLLRALAGEEHENDIFIVGDSHQRIYKNHPVLSRCGINIRGRSRSLKINYRTTEEIRKYAFALLNGISFDNLNDEIDLDDKCQSLTHGVQPTIKNFRDAAGELAYLVETIKGLTEKGVELQDICVVARTNRLAEDYLAQFTKAALRCYEIKRNKSDNRSQDGLRVATMHRVKGLEFKYVFVVAANHRVVPLASAVKHTDAITEAETLTSEKCLLYVAMTRAQKEVYITSYGKQSEFIG